MMAINMMREFFKLEASGGILLGLAAILALIVNNSPLSAIYEGFLVIPVAIQFGALEIDKPLLLWINDALMAIFFLLVGLEIKREMTIGQLSSRQKIMLPAIAALGGLSLPALIYAYFNWGDAVAIDGWAIPAATDIAFALGVMVLLGKRVPETLKICLVAIAILDDLAAIIIIAIFYTANLSLMSLGLGALALIVLFVLNRMGVKNFTPYVLAGIVLWVCVLKSGVHATLAGVALAMFIPLEGKKPSDASPLETLEHGLHPWVAFAILPIFAFANAGVSLAGLSMDLLLHPITIGIAAGLFFGKQIGVMLTTYIAVMLRLCHLPERVSWAQYYGMSLLTGIGFTMSLFIGGLAFADPELQVLVRLGVITGSVLSGVLGYLVLVAVSPKPSHQTP
ncbi:MAG: Na+/H+ antiporter NhaA [Alphaproteobacteria bacterium]